MRDQVAVAVVDRQLIEAAEELRHALRLLEVASVLSGHVEQGQSLDSRKIVGRVSGRVGAGGAVFRITSRIEKTIGGRDVEIADSPGGLQIFWSTRRTIVPVSFVLASAGQAGHRAGTTKQSNTKRTIQQHLHIGHPRFVIDALHHSSTCLSGEDTAVKQVSGPAE
ncbi:MAG: hypothetical protein ACYC3X_29180 [Pirellulaceae bacterium]